MQNVGSSLLRILGSAAREDGAPNPAKMSDALGLIESVVESKDFRDRCAALSNLSNDVPMHERQELCRSLLIILTSTQVPKEKPAFRPDGTIDHDVFRTTTKEYCTLAAPVPGSKWEEHVHAEYKKTGAPDWVRVSPYLAEMIMAFEHLFGVPGSLLVR